MDSLAEVSIKRITINGGIVGGAYECKKCPLGTVSSGLTFHCMACQVGTQPNEDKTMCMPCAKGFYNQEEGGTCKRCPPFTHSRRHKDDSALYDKETKKMILDEAATHCELDPELHIRQTGQIYKASHFSAR